MNVCMHTFMFVDRFILQKKIFVLMTVLTDALFFFVTGRLLNIFQYLRLRLCIQFCLLKGLL